MKSRHPFGLGPFLILLGFLMIGAADARPKMTNSQKNKADACYQDYYDCQVGCALDKSRTADQCSYECGTYYFACMKKAGLSRFTVDVTKTPLIPPDKVKGGDNSGPSNRIRPGAEISTEPTK